MTRKDCLELRPGQIVYDRWHQNYDGTPSRWKVNGKVRTWKTKPDVYVPIKHGLYDFDAITLTNADRFTLNEEEASNG